MLGYPAGRIDKNKGAVTTIAKTPFHIIEKKEMLKTLSVSKYYGKNLHNTK
ncbi:hypothetical protein HMPREF9136_1643 [Prevotella dentalis DSM 3688]|uniref:Uncharacterized protein n=1 Tax=Prevotella dentalis (strain ATCC 49559 / DSM 3688 / JCM 13448 / NCTC 12043 / ES 2772) TaxID=908937 RepID=F9D465_PREDD|nr:hypothetical protein HMPREF9136_1643 [Prevotella dentalis DSM 3688]